MPKIKVSIEDVAEVTIGEGLKVKVHTDEVKVDFDLTQAELEHYWDVLSGEVPSKVRPPEQSHLVAVNEVGDES